MATAPYPDPRFPPSPYYRFLQVAAQQMRPRLSVELGVCGGGGSLHLAMGYGAGKVIGIDIADDHKENTRYILDRCHNFELWIGDSCELAIQVHATFGKVDILFVDTTHTLAQTMKEFNIWRPYLNDGALVCLDDLHRPGMEDAWNEVSGRIKVRLDMLHPGSQEGGFGAIVV